MLLNSSAAHEPIAWDVLVWVTICKATKYHRRRPVYRNTKWSCHVPRPHIDRFRLMLRDKGDSTKEAVSESHNKVPNTLHYRKSMSLIATNWSLSTLQKLPTQGGTFTAVAVLMSLIYTSFCILMLVLYCTHHLLGFSQCVSSNQISVLREKTHS